MKERWYKILNKKKPQTGIVNIITIDDNCNKISCNITDFVGWCETIGLMRTSMLEKIDSYANFFVAYHSHITANNIEDTPEYRIRWFDDHKNHLIIYGMTASGF